MAREITVVSNVVIRAGYISRQYQENYTIDMSGRKGPTPGALTVGPDGVDVDLAELVEPGFVYIKNLGEVYTVHWGVRDPQTDLVYLIGQIGPGKSLPFEFSDMIQGEYQGTGTGTGPFTNTFHLKCPLGTTVVSVEVYER